MVEDTIEIRRSGWGYVYLDVQVDGGFIQVDKPVVSQEDFDGGIYHLNYRIRPEHLHAGRNFGAVSLVSVKGTMRIPIEAVGEEMPGASAHESGRLQGQSAKIFLSAADL